MNTSNRLSKFTLNAAQRTTFRAGRVSFPLLVVTLVALVMGAYPAIPAHAASGDLDTTFGANGKVITSFNGYTDAEANAVAVQSDGKVVAAGRAFAFGSGGSGGVPGDFALARYNTDGTLDIFTFGNNGLVTTGFPNNTEDEAFAIAIQSDGKIVVARLHRY